MDLSKWKTNDKHCIIGGQMILLGQYGRLSPCMNCLCSAEGVIIIEKFNHLIHLMEYFSFFD